MASPVLPEDFRIPGEPISAIDFDRIRKRLTFYFPAKLPHYVKLVQKRRWHHLICSRCGRHRVEDVRTAKADGTLWACVNALAWAREHSCKRGRRG